MNQKQSQSFSAPAPAERDHLFGAYSPDRRTFDEFRDQTGDAKAAWTQFANRIHELGREGLENSWKRGETMLRENGIAYNLLVGGPETERRWNLDPLPFLIYQDEWEHLAKGVVQRAQLLNRVLHDCYGPQTLLTSGILPAPLLFSQPNFNRSLCDIPKPNKPLLSLYAVDVARGPDGSWKVIADRTESPNGIGFALENRIVITNVFSETSKRLNIIRLASFFQNFNATLRSLTSSAIDSPKVVMLSPGAGDRAFFEDAFLARYLGITLAIGSELTVRNDRLFLKTVRGLQRVHVLIRRVCENDIDPLETPSSSHLGVPGLMQAMRAGNVVVVNPPGTGIVEAPALLPYLPAMARHFLGQDLLLPSIETEWNHSVGTSSSLLDSGNAVVKSAFTRNLFTPTLTRHLTKDQLGALRQEIWNNPAAYVIQREMPFSTAPVWTGDSIEARPVAIRLFLFADGDTYKVLPGGLVRAASQADTLPGLSLRENTSSKDLWVIGSVDRAPQLQTTNLPAGIAIRRNSGTLSSQAADNMLWLGRYSERAEFATRTLLEIVQIATEEQESSELAEIPPLLATLSKLDYIDSTKLDRFTNSPAGRKLLLEELSAIFFKSASPRPTNLDSVPNNIRRLRDLASISRDRLSNETWRIIQSLDQRVSMPAPRRLVAFREPMQEVILLQSAFNGTCRENITRSESWRFLNIGRRLERCSWLLTMVEEILRLYPSPPSAVLDSALSIIDCTMTYRFRYQGAPQPLPALDLILFDPVNPRGLVYQLADLQQSFAELPAPENDRVLRAPHRTILKAINFLQTEILNTDDVFSEAMKLKELQQFISNLRAELPSIYEQLSWEFFTHASFTAS
jgi:uncharacterized circularly permuted ATP-grasp superfamily protein/uncharacterized alpha-E superfamily protein